MNKTDFTASFSIQAVVRGLQERVSFSRNKVNISIEEANAKTEEAIAAYNFLDLMDTMTLAVYRSTYKCRSRGELTEEKTEQTKALELAINRFVEDLKKVEQI